MGTLFSPSLKNSAGRFLCLVRHGFQQYAFASSCCMQHMLTYRVVVPERSVVGCRGQSQAHPEHRHSAACDRPQNVLVTIHNDSFKESNRIQHRRFVQLPCHGRKEPLLHLICNHKHCSKHHLSQCLQQEGNLSIPTNQDDYPAGHAVQQLRNRKVLVTGAQARVHAATGLLLHVFWYLYVASVQLLHQLSQKRPHQVVVTLRKTQTDHPADRPHKHIVC